MQKDVLLSLMSVSLQIVPFAAICRAVRVEDKFCNGPETRRYPFLLSATAGLLLTFHRAERMMRVLERSARTNNPFIAGSGKAKSGIDRLPFSEDLQF